VVFSGDAINRLEAIKENLIMSPPAKKVPISEEEISFVVNGDLYEVRVKLNWTLQYVLHNELGLTLTTLPQYLFQVLRNILRG